MKNTKLAIIIISIYIPSVFGTNPIDVFTNNPLMANANISLLVRELETGRTIASYRPTNSTIPASTIKLITSATALELFGSDYRYQTKLEIDGSISKDSVLRGNIFIRGSGDPTLGSSKMGDVNFLDKWVQSIKNVGIRKVIGEIIPDASIFDNEGVNPKWTWEDIGNYYAAGAYGISYMDNTFQLILRSGAVNTTPQIIRTVPNLPQLVFDNHLKSTTIGFDSAYFYCAPYSNFKTIRGAIPANVKEFCIKGDIPNPGLLLAEHFKDRLQAYGITIVKPEIIQSSVSKTRNEIYTHFSPPLHEILKEINEHSNNHYAEHVFRTLALKNEPIGSNQGAITILKSYWKSKGLPVHQLVQHDGSGLSPSNAVSALFYVQLLSYMHTKSAHSKAFISTLPVAGVNGTLSKFLKGTRLQAKVKAKSGTISRVKCYAGYMDVKDKKYTFAIMVNNANGSSKAVTTKIEQFLLSICN
jgi:D-alanyl-D-alanine carboxypeptidase/D-alanyl-D-alanine-endopeptidase (penicillin-binding protein 4)